MNSGFNSLQTSLTPTKTLNNFGKKINSITGNNIPEPHYLINTTNEKVYTYKGKEIIHREHWSEIFKDNNEENEDDADNTDLVLEYLQNNIQSTIPYDNTDLARLGTCVMDSIITCEEVNNIIKKLRKTSPGESGVNKAILANLPDTAIARLTDIFNNSLSAGYFPDRWKKAIVTLIPKEGKSPHYVHNYRPISLLEVPGKI